MKNLLRLRAIPLLCWLSLQLLCTSASAQFPYTESFKNKTVNDFVLGGSAVLTANLSAGADPDGSGYLRLTSPVNNQTGYAYAQNAFPTTRGLTVSFEFFIYKNPPSGQADGISFFLFDANTPSFRAGGTGGALGYTQRVDNITNIPGLSMGYLGIGIDEYGNFSNQTDNKKSGGIGSQPGSIVIRGPGNGSGPTDYVYRTGVKTGDAPYNIPFTGFTQRYPDSTHANYRRLKIVLTPGSTLGAGRGFTLTVILYKGGVPNPEAVTIIDQHDYPFEAPERLKYGFAASTGGATNYHEIRGIDIRPTVTNDLLPPATLADDLTIVCQGGQGMLDILSNDQAQNGSGLHKASIDLDPALAGIQKTFTDPGKGTYSVNAEGLVVFTAENGFSGQSTASYTVADEYGMTSLATAMQVTVNSGTPPELTVTNPAAVCFPQTVDLTSNAVAGSSAPGAVLRYFETLSDANAGTNAIDAQAGAIGVSGTYFISAADNGCTTVKPVVVSIHQPPTVASAGADQPLCNKNTGNLVGNNPSSGTGLWSQVSGPNTAGISTPNSSNTPLTGLVAGTYTFRWTVSSGACPASTDDVQLVIWNSPTTANAGSAQNLCNVSDVQLQGNTPTVGTGTWTQVGTPAVTIQSPASPATTVTGLTTGNTYRFKWTITNGVCPASASEVLVSISENTTANAGPDLLTSDANGVQLAANTPASGNTGTWAIRSGPAGHTAVIDYPSDPHTTVSSLNKAGEYLLRWTVANSGCGQSNFDEMKLTVSSLLPVTFVSFTGKQEGSEVRLAWTTAGEKDHRHFNIERSTDGTRFVSIDKMEAGASPGAVKNYAYRDNIGRLSAPVVYYRLKQVDQNGSYTYSAIVAVALTGGKGLLQASITPNPFTSFISLRVSAQRSEKLSVRLYDEKGRQVCSAIKNLVQGENSVRIDDLEMLSAGVYILELVSESRHERQKVIRQ